MCLGTDTVEVPLNIWTCILSFHSFICTLNLNSLMVAVISLPGEFQAFVLTWNQSFSFKLSNLCLQYFFCLCFGYFVVVAWFLAGFKLAINLLPLLPDCGDQRYMPQFLANVLLKHFPGYRVHSIGAMN